MPIPTPAAALRPELAFWALSVGDEDDAVAARLADAASGGNEAAELAEVALGPVGFVCTCDEGVVVGIYRSWVIVLARRTLGAGALKISSGVALQLS